jgi:hypothetical protein
MLIEASIHAGLPNTRAKAAGEEKMFTAFHSISAEKTVSP